MRLLMCAIAIAALAGCGVKGDPSYPEGSVFNEDGSIKR